MKIPNDLNEILTKINEIGTAYIVGGAVRNHFLNIDYNDYDIEVYGVYFDDLKMLLENFGKINVYENFGVLSCLNYEFCLPRTESKRGDKHTDFEVLTNPFLDLKTACLRRDFTCNQIMFNTKSYEYIDHFNGLEAIKNKELILISEKFSEDPLRALRAFRFMCTLGFSIDFKTKLLCLNLLQSINTLSIERINEEFHKAFLGSFLLSTLETNYDFLNYFIPFEAMKNTVQSPIYHPEGDVFEHTLQTLDALNFIDFKEENRFILVCTLILHDIGKICTTIVTKKRISSHNHEYESFVLSQNIIHFFTNSKKEKNLILMLVRDHLFPRTFLNKSNKEKLDLYLMYKDNFYLLLTVAWCDYTGRTIDRDKSQYVIRKDEYYLNYIISWNDFTSRVDSLFQEFNGNYFLNLGIESKEIGIRQYEEVLKNL